MCFLWLRLIGAVFGLAADNGFIDFDHLVGAAEPASLFVGVLIHCFANAMAHKPSALIGDIHHSVHLVS